MDVEIEFKELVAIAARVLQLEENNSLWQENLKRIALTASLLEEVPTALEKDQEEFILNQIERMKELPDWQQAMSMVKQAIFYGEYRPM